ncbi:hypothetical protein [Burkholderia pseudomallei]|uniref:hypothetical protein n=1 Tax=Burkholderia pseudomallei TaxID=28450 RepID=UPI001AAEB6F9|nr:hypothetical protein [Burkholderia pseudomallei]MBO2955109.1 hypothetical protein [Burkholderia pseudomallei]
MPVVPDEEPDRQTGDRFEHGRRRADVIAGDEVRIAERAQVGRRRSGGRERLLVDPSDAMRVQRAPVRIETALKRTFDRGNAARFADEPAASARARARAWRAWRPPSAGVRRCSVRTRRVHAKMVVDPAPHGYRSNAPRRTRRSPAGVAPRTGGCAGGSRITPRARRAARVGAAKNFLATRVDSGGIRSS